MATVDVPALLAVLGSTLAFGMTHWTARLVERLLPYQMAASIKPDLRVLAFALVIAATALTPPPVEAPRGGIRPPEALQS